MRQWPKRKVKRVRIEIIPMIDVMMFLLVFFVLISVNVLPSRGINIAVPSAQQPDRIEERKRVTVALAPGNGLFLDGDPLTMAELPAKLHVPDGAPKPLVTIAGDAGTELQRLVDVIAALKEAGIPAASIIAKPR